MFARNARFPRTAIAFALAAGIAMSGTLPAFADGVVNIAGGDLTMTIPTVGDFTLLDMELGNTATATVDFSVTDATGSGDGWKITAAATQFTEWDGSDYVEVTPKTITVGALKFADGDLDFTKAGDTIGDLTPQAAVATQSLAAGAFDSSDGLTTVKVASAAQDTGMGEYDASGSLTLTVPASTYAGQYKSTVTLTKDTAP